MYNPSMVQPMRDELTSIGIKELKTPEEVDSYLKESAGTKMIVVNSICGCAAGGARPGVKMALQGDKKPDSVATVFAGQDTEATERARSYFHGYPPSSPSAALLKDGKVVYMLERRDIEGSRADEIAEKLRTAFEKFC